MTQRLSRDLHTRVTVQKVRFSLLNRMHLEGLLVEDRQQDTLLYAGDMNVRITDWFIFKKKAELKYVGLNDALIKFQRNDSVWNQQFLFDYFGGSGKKDTTRKKGGIQFSLRKADLRNVTFIQQDNWLGQEMTVKIGSLSLAADNLSFSGSDYRIGSLSIDRPLIAIRNFRGLKPADSLQPLRKETVTAARWNPGNMVVNIADLTITNGSFANDSETGRPPLPYFDGQHLLFTEVNGRFGNLRLNADTVTASMQLVTKERCGLEIKKFDAKVRFTPQTMAFDQLDLQTNRSILRHHYSMSYNHLDELGDYIDKVKMNAEFDDSYVDSDDIAFFAPALGNWKRKIMLKGKIRGTVDDLVGRELSVQAGANTFLSGDITLTGLPDIDRTFIDLRADDFRTNYGDAATIAPAIRKIKNPDLRKISYARFRGNFTGFIRDFVTFGTIQTNLGTLVTDLNMKLPAGKDPVYAGNIATAGFRLGQFLGDKNIGDVSAKLSVKGKGFNSRTVNTMMDGAIRYFDYNGYRYENLVLEGTLEKKMFTGNASIDDPGLHGSLLGTINFNTPTPRFDFKAEWAHADLRMIGLTKDSITFSGKLNAGFNSSNFDNFLGKASLIEAELIRNGERIPFDSLVVEAFYVNNDKMLSFESNEFSARISGEYKLKDLPNAFRYLLNKYYPSYVAAPARTPAGQHINFEVETYYIEPYLQIFTPGLSGFNNSLLSGKIDVANHALNFYAKVPMFRYRNFYFDSVNVDAEGDAQRLSLKARADNITINDSMNLPRPMVSITASRDSSWVGITSGANRTVDTANLNALVLTYNDGARINVNAATFTLNGKTWNIQDNGVLEFRKNIPASGLLVMTEGDQRIQLQTEPSSKGKWNDLRILLTNLNIGDFSPFFLPRNEVEGIVSGTILAENPTGHLRITADDIRTRLLRMDNDSIGELRASLSYDNADGHLKFDGETLNTDNYLGFNGNLHLGDKDRAKENNISLTARRYPLKVLERFLGSLFADIQGYLTGNVNLDGDFSELAVSGKGRLTDAGLKVMFTQCSYLIDDTDIELTPELINLDGIVLTDPVTRNKIYLTGGIEHQSFRNLFYNLDISTRRPGTRAESDNRPVQLLRTTMADNKTFYGDVKGKGMLQLRGSQSDMFMKIDASASEKDSSYISLPSYVGRESGIADFLVERKYGRELADSDFQATTNITYDVDVTANPAVTVKVILDELTGDEIKGRGNGSLNIRSGTSEPLTLRGRFDIIEGDYLFTFQSFFKKPFELKKDATNYIEWNGDPYDAAIQLDARYKAEKVSFAPLGELLNITDLTRVREDVYVAAKLSGSLFKPAFSFRLEFPPSSRANTDPSISLNIQQIEKNENEMNKQVAYLIVFNSFAPVNSNSLGNPINEFAYSTFSSISGLLFNQINKVMSNTLAKIFKSDNIGFNISGSLYNRNLLSSGNSLLPNQSQLDISIPISLFSDRFFINVGSTVDVPLQGGNTLQQSLRFLPDVTLEWLINASGTIRASFFYRENSDFLSSSSSGGPGLARRYGGNISYRKDFDRLRDIFRRRNKKNVQEPSRDSLPPTPVTGQ